MEGGRARDGTCSFSDEDSNVFFCCCARRRLGAILRCSQADGHDAKQEEQESYTSGHVVDRLCCFHAVCRATDCYGFSFHEPVAKSKK